LYPEIAINFNIAGLGKTITLKGYVMKPIVEVKHLTVNTWVQWIDVAKDNVFDGICDFALSITINKDGILELKTLSCNQAFQIIDNYCLNNDINIEDFLHIINTDDNSV